MIALLPMDIGTKLPLTTLAYTMTKGWVDNVGAVDLDGAIASVKAYEPYYQISDEDALAGLEQLASAIPNLTDAQLKNMVDMKGAAQ